MHVLLFFRCIGIRAVDENEVPEGGEIAFDAFDGSRIDAEHLGRQPWAGDERWPHGGWSGAAGLDDFGTDEGIDEGAFSGAGAAEGCDDEGSIEANAEGIGSLDEPADEGAALVGGLPGRGFVGPASKSLDERVDFGEDFQMGEFGSRHSIKIAVPRVASQWGAVSVSVRGLGRGGGRWWRRPRWLDGLVCRPSR